MTRSNLTRRNTRRASVAAAAVVALGGLTACGSDSAGQEAGAVTTSDLQEIEDQLGGLDERLGTLEEGLGGGLGEGEGEGVAEGGDDEGLFTDPESYLGQEVTISAEVSELYTTTDVGSSFRIAGESGEPISVISASPVEEIDSNDVVQVSGTVQQVNRDTFEEDFGIVDEDLFDDVDGFYADEEGQLAIAADQIRVTQEAAETD